MIDGIGDALKLGTKITNVMEKLLTDTSIREEFRRAGHIAGVFSLGDYQVDFTVTNKAFIPDAEIEVIE